MGLFKEFKEFISKGNVIELAIGVIIGAAFGKIVSSFVEDLFMPPIGLITDSNYKNLKWELKPATGGEEAITMNYGIFLQHLIDFIIIAIALFIIIKAVNMMYKSKEKEDKKKDEVILLEKILSELKNKNN